MLSPRVISVKPLPDYKLYLTFENGEEKIFDVRPYMEGDWYGKLRQSDFFQTVHADGHGVVWADGQDIAPHELYENSIPSRVTNTDMEKSA